MKEYLEAALPKSIPFTHFPAGEVRDKRTGAKLKHMGLKPGWSDFIVATNPVLFIELKYGKGRLTESQSAFSRQVEDLGHHFIVARSVNDVADALLGVLGERVRVTV